MNAVALFQPWEWLYIITIAVACVSVWLLMKTAYMHGKIVATIEGIEYNTAFRKKVASDIVKMLKEHIRHYQAHTNCEGVVSGPDFNMFEIEALEHLSGQIISKYELEEKDLV